jgi:methyltransferase (TIGR00027 family)
MWVNIAAAPGPSGIGENDRVDADSPASRTALGAARHRAVHQVLEQGAILSDPLAVAVTGDHPDDLVARANARGDARMRWFVCARSRFAEQVLAVAVAAGVDQLVVLGAGLDTFAYRNPHPALRVTEVDHPATRAWKLERLAAAGITVPAGMEHAAVDFEQDDPLQVLGVHGVDLERPVLFWWLGVTPYLSGTAVEDTLRRLGSLPSSAVVLDHAAPDPQHSAATSELMRRRREAVARLGEPWLSAYAYPDLAELVRRCGFTDVEAVDERVMIRRCLGLPPAQTPRPTHLALAVRGWPVTSRAGSIVHIVP